MQATMLSTPYERQVRMLTQLIQELPRTSGFYRVMHSSKQAENEGAGQKRVGYRGGGA